jgi:lipoprotein signal peptidase
MSILLIALSLSFLVDQLTKLFVIFFGTPFFNTQGPLGIGVRYPKFLVFWRVFQWFLLFFMVLIAVRFSFQDFLISLGLGLTLGGHFSNVLDHKIRDGAVDFIPLPFPTFRGTWARGNISDFSIIIGTILFLIGSWNAIF